MSNHDFKDDVEAASMGLMTAYRWNHDPQTVLFMLARYKWASKMLAGYGDVLEVGCADGFGSRIVRRTVDRLTCIDIDKQMIENAQDINDEDVDIHFINCSMAGISGKPFDAVYALDVLEHVTEEKEFMEQFSGLAPVGIIGMPSLESQEYASPLSKANHVNCKTEPQLRKMMKSYYKHVFMFSMNDEIVGTSFGPMAHYRFALGVN